MTQYDCLVAAAKRGDTAYVLQHADGVLIHGDCPPDKVGWVFYYKGNAALDEGQPILSIAAGEQALTWAQSHPDVDLEGRTRIFLSYAMMRIGRVADAAELMEEYLAGLPQHPEWKQFEDIARFNLGWAYRQSGRLPQAVEQYRGALALPESVPGGHIPIRQNLAWALMLLGDAEGAREQLEVVAQHVRETLSLQRLTSLWVDRAALKLLEGDTAGAKEACRQILAALDEKERATSLATTYITLGRIALAEGQPAEAQRCSLLARTHAEKAERWDLHNEGTRLWVSASEKGGTKREENGLASVARLLVIGRSDK